MKKFIFKMIPVLMLLLMVGVVFPMAVDPYNVFHVNSVRDNGIEPNKNYIKTKYILENPEKYNAFLFGSSRVGAIHTDKIDGVNCYNMTYSEGLPAEHLENLKIFIQNGIVPQTVYLGVDDISLFQSPDTHEADPMHMSYPQTFSEKVSFLDTYLNARLTLDSISVTQAYTPTDDNFADNLYSYGWWLDYDYPSTFAADEFTPVWGANYKNREAEVLDEIEQMKELCDANDIELVVFTNPVHFFDYEEAVSSGYREFLYDLAGVTDYYNFSGINVVTINSENYVDYSHYTAEVGDMILNCIQDGQVDPEAYENCFGWYITMDNRDEFLERMEEIDKREM